MKKTFIKDVNIALVIATLLALPLVGFAKDDDHDDDDRNEVRARAQGNVMFEIDEDELPPGIQLRLERGKDIPPGIFRRFIRAIAAAPVDTTAPLISNVSITTETDSAMVSWQTNEPSRGRVRIVRPEIDGNWVFWSRGLSQMHQVKITGLSPGTDYALVIDAWDRSGNQSTSNERAFRTIVEPPDTTAPVVSRVRINAAENRAIVSWRTNEETTGEVRYTTAATVGNDSPMVASGALREEHRVQLTGLTANTEYRLMITARDASGNVRQSETFTFRTKPVGDTIAPRILFVTVVAQTKTSARIVWVTNERSDSRVWVSATNPPNTNVTPTQVSENLDFVHSMEISGLSPDTTYFFVVSSTDAQGNVKLSGVSSFETEE